MTTSALPAGNTSVAIAHPTAGKAPTGSAGASSQRTHEQTGDAQSSTRENGGASSAHARTSRGAMPRQQRSAHSGQRPAKDSHRSQDRSLSDRSPETSVDDQNAASGRDNHSAPDTYSYSASGADGTDENSSTNADSPTFQGLFQQVLSGPQVSEKPSGKKDARMLLPGIEIGNRDRSANSAVLVVNPEPTKDALPFAFSTTSSQLKSNSNASTAKLEGEASDPRSSQTEDESAEPIAVPLGIEAFSGQIKSADSAPDDGQSQTTTKKADTANASRVEHPKLFAVETPSSESAATVSASSVPTAPIPTAAPPVQPNATNHVSSVDAVRATESLESPKPTGQTERMRDISLHLPGSHGVEIRLSERAGEIHVNVRSNDSALTQDLRGNLHELVSGLERKGFSTDLSHPVEPVHHTIETQSAGDASSNGQNGGFDDRQQQGEQQQRQREEFLNFTGRTQKVSPQVWNETWNSNTQARPE